MKQFKEFKVDLEERQYERLKSFAKTSNCFMVDLVRKAINKVIESPQEIAEEVLADQESRKKLREKPVPHTLVLEMGKLRDDLNKIQFEQEDMWKRIRDLSYNFDQIQSFQKNLISCLIPLAQTTPPNHEKSKLKELPSKPIQKPKPHQQQPKKPQPPSEAPVEVKVPLNRIVIPEEWMNRPPKEEKVQTTINFYKEHGKFDKLLSVKKENMVLVDGFKRYLAAKKLGLEEISIEYV